MLNKKDLMVINQQFSTGRMLNAGSLDFVLESRRHSPHWFQTMCLLARAILIDHVFEDGNKRTAGAVIMAYLDMHGYAYNPEKITKVVLQVAKKSLRNATKIGILIKNAAL